MDEEGFDFIDYAICAAIFICALYLTIKVFSA